MSHGGSSHLLAGRYRIDAPLGRGGAARVYRVADTARGTLLALKLLDAHAPPHIVAMFELEYRTLASLSHPRMVTVYDYGLDDGSPFYTMELLQGEDLKDRAPVRWREACGYLRDAAQALGLLHARGLLHRDVSPRNLWRTPDGRVTLLDFGGIARFGRASHVVGTPPFVPPEALDHRALDQRADLYALGAVGYYLLTGLQAFPARDVRELPDLWKTPPAPVSQRVAELRRTDLESVPPQLDVLMTSLLSLQPLARPSGTDELIDRLDAVLGTTRPSREEVAQLRLANSAFVGRMRERTRLRRLLGLAEAGRGQCCRIEAEPGMGSSRLLRELALEAQVRPAIVARVDAASQSSPYGSAEALVWQLLDALPEVARSAAAPYAATLGLLSPRLRMRLGTTASVAAAPELRVRIQRDLCDWFLGLAASRTVVLIVDGLEHLDEGSAAFLHALALGCRPTRLLLLLAARTDPSREPRLTERALRDASHPLVLGPLAHDEALELLGSIFGDAEHLDRLCDRLHRAAGGNPGHLLELTDMLVRREFIGFVSGTWVLPRDLTDEQLASSRLQISGARLEALSQGARSLARVLAVAGGPIGADLARVLADGVAESLFLSLAELLERGIAVRDADRVWIKHDAHRAALRDELAAPARARVERALGEAMLARAGDDALEQLRAGLHLMEGGQARGADLVTKAALDLALRDELRLPAALPVLEACLARFERDGRPAHERLTLLAPLAMSGYYANLRYAARYGDAALAVLQDFVGLSLARKLRPLLGAERAVRAALAFAAARARIHRDNPRVPSQREAMTLLFSCVATLIGASNLCTDTEGAARRAAVLEPFAALGPDQFAAFMHAYCAAIAQTSRDRAGQSVVALRAVIERMETTPALAGLPEALRRRYLGGALVSLGSLESVRDGELALQIADRLEALGGRRYAMNADQVRTAFYANQGDYVRFESARKRVEQHAIQLGTTGLVETWTLSMLMGFCLRTRDTITMKRISEQLQRIQEDVPTLDTFAKRARAGYLLLRGDFAEALPIFEETLTVKDQRRMGWRRLHGLVARIYNLMGQHAHARALCLRVHADQDDEEALFPSLSLLQRTELVIAEAGLGEVTQARARLDALIALHAPRRGPLTMGQLHETGLEVARITGDEAGLWHHLAQLERWYVPTGTPSLVQLCQTLRARIQKRDDEALARSDDAARTIERQLAGGALTAAERAHVALTLLLRRADASSGALYVLDDARRLQPFAVVGDPPPEEAALWVSERVDAERAEDVTQTATMMGPAPARAETRAIAGRHLRVAVLRARNEDIVGAVLLASEAAPPARCTSDVLHTIGDVLASALRKERQDAPSA